MSLKLGEDFTIPPGAVTQTFAILARKGAGKTYLANVMAEEFIKNHLPVVVLDPMGAFWGLRSSADGKRAGLSITILGGEHADVPLEPTGGRMLAKFIVDHPGPYVLDMSLFESNASQDNFARDFCESLYRLKAKERGPMHLLIDEADSFAPQRPMPGQQRMLGAMEAIVRRGRIRGLGVTLITQRPAVLNKNVLTQAEILVTLQMTGTQDREAIDKWVSGNGTKEQRDELVASLASLQVGEAWFWSPSWLRCFRKVKVRKRKTLDSSKTPEVGDHVLEPSAFADVDLDALKAQMAETIERANADDPDVLRGEIDQLNQRVHELEAELEKKPEPEIREVPMLTEVQVKVMTELTQALDSILSTTDTGTWSNAVVSKPTLPPTRDAVGSMGSSGHIKQIPKKDVQTGFLTKAERKILTVLAQYPSGRNAKQVGMLSGYSFKSGHFKNMLGRLRARDCIEGDKNLIQITSAGKKQLGEWEPLPTGDALRAYWLEQLPKAAASILSVLIDYHPARIDVEALASYAGYSAESGHFKNMLGKLRSLELIEGPREGLTATKELWE